jgi:hypothetical protein
MQTWYVIIYLQDIHNNSWMVNTKEGKWKQKQKQTQVVNAERI